MVRIVPSILSADFARLESHLRQAEAGKPDWFHCDVMDGRFVPNITFGPLVVAAVRRSTKLPLDVHLMIEHPDDFLADFVKAGATSIIVHLEADVHLHRTVQKIRELGAQPGVAINPSTRVSLLSEVIADIDRVLIMSVNPGFGGQKFIQRSIDKIGQTAELIAKSGSKALIEVDGGIDTETAPSVVKAGADVLVAGNAIFGTNDPAAAIENLRKTAAAASKQ